VSHVVIWIFQIGRKSECRSTCPLAVIIFKNPLHAISCGLRNSGLMKDEVQIHKLRILDTTISQQQNMNTLSWENVLNDLVRLTPSPEPMSPGSPSSRTQPSTRVIINMKLGTAMIVNDHDILKANCLANDAPTRDSLDFCDLFVSKCPSELSFDHLFDCIAPQLTLPYKEESKCTLTPSPSSPTLSLSKPNKIEKSNKTRKLQPVKPQHIVFVDDSYNCSNSKVLREKNNKFKKKESQFDSFTKYFRIK
jgi:hypothetical protein